MITRFILTGFLASFFCCTITAQEDVSGFFMHNTLQQTHFNPALFPDSTLNISLGNFSASAFSTGDNIFAQTTTNALGETILDINALTREDVDSYGFSDVSSIELSMMFKDKWYIGVGHQVTANLFSGLTEDFINLAIDGNAPYIGQTLQLDPSFGSMAYQQIHLNIGRKFKKLNLGVRLAYLSGIGYAGTSNDQLALTTSEEFYQLTFNNDYSINASGGIDYNGLDDINFDYDYQGFGVDDGFAIDLGINYQATDQLSLSASITDLGSITWSGSPQTFTSQGVITYDGIDISDYIDDDIEIELTDSLKNILDIIETNEAFTTNLSSSIMVGANYQINNRYSVGAMFRIQNAFDNSLTTIALNGSGRLFSFLDLGVVYSVRKESPFNLGLHSVWRLGPVQLLLASDNIFGFNVSASSRSHIRGGLGLQF